MLLYAGAAAVLGLGIVYFLNKGGSSSSPPPTTPLTLQANGTIRFNSQPFVVTNNTSADIQYQIVDQTSFTQSAQFSVAAGASQAINPLLLLPSENAVFVCYLGPGQPFPGSNLITVTV